MTTARWLALAVVTLPVPAAAQEEISLEAPRPVRAHLDRLHHADPAVRADAAAALAADDRNAPFLRFERAAAPVGTTHHAALDAALAPIEARAWARHAERAKAWTRERRLDLLCEHLATCPRDDAVTVAGRVLELHQTIAAEVWPPPPVGVRPTALPRLVGVRHGHPDWRDNWTFDGRRVSLAYADQPQSFVPLLCARNGLRPTELPPRPLSGVVLANGDATVGSTDRLFLVADGDVEFVLHGTYSVLIVASGSITVKAPTYAAANNSRLYAGGAIDLPTLNDEGFNRFEAVGAVRLGTRGLDKESRTAEKVAALSVGIRFTSLDDFGVRAGSADGGVKVAAVEPWSPLARYGVRAGDVVFRVGFESIRAPDDLRRALRRGVMEESAVFHLRRGGERLTRVVYLDGIPARR